MWPEAAAAASQETLADVQPRTLELTLTAAVVVVVMTDRGQQCVVALQQQQTQLTPAQRLQTKLPEHLHVVL